MVYATVFHGRRTWMLIRAAVVCLAIGSLTTSGTAANNTVYQVFVRSFCDSDGDDEGNGDLKGLTEKLDYLNDGKPETDDDLEVGIIWLMPIFPSQSYHGYDVDNYREIDKDYGSLEDFDRFIAAAGERGVRVILDIPFNHTSNRHEWFRHAINHPATPPDRDFYHLRLGEQPGAADWHWTINDSGQRVYYFGDFGYNMPDLDMDNPEVRTAVKEVARFWLKRGVAGFRLDAAKHIYAASNTLTWDEVQRNNNWWKEFSDFVRSLNRSAILVGEVLDSKEVIHHFAWSLDGLIDQPFMHKVRDYAKQPNPGLIEWWRDFLAYARMNNPNFDLFPYVSSHDENPRLASYLKQNAPQRKEPAYRLAMYLLLTVGKYPVLYYGDEIMQEGWKWNGASQPSGDGSNVYDETLREPFPWRADGEGDGQTTWFPPRFDLPKDGISVGEQSSPTTMRGLVRALTNLRAENPNFADGEISKIHNDTAAWIVFEKGAGPGAFLTLINTAATEYEYRFHSEWLPEYANARRLFRANGMTGEWEDTTDQDNRIEGSSVTVPPVGLVILGRP